MLFPHITWEDNHYRMSNYEGYFTEHPQVRVQKVEGEEEGVYYVHWDKWVYYTISMWDSEEEYLNGNENYDKETLVYVGIEEGVKEHSECSNQELLEVLWYEPEEGGIVEVYPRRYCGVQVHLPSGEVNWDTHEWGESYTDRTLIYKEGMLLPYQEEE